MNFETEVKIADWDSNRHTKGVIKWEIDFEVRSWGVKSIYIHIPDQIIKVVWEVETEDGYEDVDGEIKIENCDHQLDIHEHGEAILPDELEISKQKYKLCF